LVGGGVNGIKPQKVKVNESLVGQHTIFVLIGVISVIFSGNKKLMDRWVAKWDKLMESKMVNDHGLWYLWQCIFHKY